MKYKPRKPRPNEMPYLLDFARNIGLTQRYIASQLGVCDATVSPWATGIDRPKDYDTICPKVKQMIADKLKSDIDEWMAYLNRVKE